MGELSGAASLSGGLKPYIAMALVVVANVSANVLLKLGSGVEEPRAIVLGLFGWQFFAGILCFAIAVVLYAWSLKYLPLYVAQTIASLQFAGAIMAAHFLFGETITPDRWIGIASIILGIVLVMR